MHRTAAGDKGEFMTPDVEEFFGRLLALGGAVIDMVVGDSGKPLAAAFGFEDVAAYNERVMGPAHVYRVLDEAIKTALARRSVAHITIPKDMQKWDTLDVE